jgi:hypothetical protein
MEGSGGGLIYSTTPAFTGSNWVKERNPKWGYQVSRKNPGPRDQEAVMCLYGNAAGPQKKKFSANPE